MFNHRDEKHLIHIRDMTVHIRKILRERFSSLLTAFSSFDKNQDGWISQDELISAFQDLNLTMSNDDIVDLLHHADLNQDGFLNFRCVFFF